MGKLARTGNGTPLSKPPSLTVKQLEQQRTKSNSDILKKIKDDTKMSSQLLQACQDDQAKGRMDRPRLSHEVDLEVVTLSPRFAVVQGKKDDGSTRVRPIDDFTKSGCNAATETTEKLSYESLDALLAVLRALEGMTGSDLVLWKADIDSAYRRVSAAHS